MIAPAISPTVWWNPCGSCNLRFDPQFRDRAEVFRRRQRLVLLTLEFTDGVGSTVNKQRRGDTRPSAIGNGGRTTSRGRMKVALFVPARVLIFAAGNSSAWLATRRAEARAPRAHQENTHRLAQRQRTETAPARVEFRAAQRKFDRQQTR